MEETNRQKKIGKVLQKELAEVLQQELRKTGNTGIIISVSKVSVAPDLSLAKAYLSIFPNKSAKPLLEELQKMKSQLKHKVALSVKNQLRKMPDLVLYLDDSLEYIENIEEAVKGKEDPIENPDLLDKRKKS